jgi:hypothetical protein
MVVEAFLNNWKILEVNNTWMLVNLWTIPGCWYFLKLVATGNCWLAALITVRNQAWLLYKSSSVTDGWAEPMLGKLRLGCSTLGEQYLNVCYFILLVLLSVYMI